METRDMKKLLRQALLPGAFILACHAVRLAEAAGDAAKAAFASPYRKRAARAAVYFSAFFLGLTASAGLLHQYMPARAQASVPTLSAGPFADRGRIHALTDEIRGAPDTLMNLSGAQVVQIFDEPALKRREGDIQVWQYRGVSCVLDVYMKSGAKDGEAASVIHYETRERKKAELEQPKTAAAETETGADDRACVTALLDGGSDSISIAAAEAQ
jgi:hypothetical protein